MKLKKVIAAVTAAAVAVGSFTAYSIVSPKFSLSAEMSPEYGRIIVDTEEDSGIAFAFYDRAEDASGEPIEQIEDEPNKYAVDADTEILAVVTLPDTLEDGKKLSVFYGEETESFFENDKITFSFSFAMPEEGIVVSAEIKDLDTYNITAVTDGEGSVTINGRDASEGVQVAENSEVTVEAVPAEGYEVGTVMVITDWETFGIDSGDSFVMPSGDVEVQVTFTEKSEGKYTIDVLGPDADRFTVTVNGIETNSANAGDIVTVTGYPRDGYELQHIQVVCSSEGRLTTTLDTNNKNIFTFIMPADEVRCYVGFGASEYKINTIITDSNMGSAYVTSVYRGLNYIYTNSNTFFNETAYTDDNVVIIAVPAEDCKLDTIAIVDSNDMPVIFTQDDNKVTFSMPASDITVTVNFTERSDNAQTYTVSADDTANGSITVNSEAEEGETISICCVPDIGYKLAEITITTENGEVYSGEDYIRKESFASHNYCSGLFNNGSRLYTFTMPASNITVTVNFKKTYEIKANISPTIWSVILSVEDSGFFTEQLYDATYDSAIHNIRASEGDIVKIEANSTTYYNNYFVIDNDGKIVDISVVKQTTIDGVHAGDLITFTMPDSDVTINAFSDDKKYLVRISPTEKGRVEAMHQETETDENGVTVTTITLTVVPDAGYEINDCSVIDSEGNAVDTSIEENIITFIMPDSPDSYVTVTITFKGTNSEESNPGETTSDTEEPDPEETTSDTEEPDPEVTSSDIDKPNPDESDNESLTVEIDEENKITDNGAVKAGGDVDPGKTVDIKDENSNASAAVKLPDKAESGLSFVITNKTDEIIESANKILAEAAKLSAEKASAIKFTIESILNNKSKGFAYELKFIDSSGNTVKVEGAFVKAALPVPQNLLPENTNTASFFVYHATAKGFEKINSIFNAANNTVEFAATDFSPYLITLEELDETVLAPSESGSEEENPDQTSVTSKRPAFVPPTISVSSTETNSSTGSVTAAPIPTTSSLPTTVPPPAAASSAAAAETSASGSTNSSGKPDSENTSDTTARSTEKSSGMGIADTNAMTGLALELVPLLAVTAIGIIASKKRK